MSMYAEERPYWRTEVSTGKSQGELVETLEHFGADNIQFSQGSTQAGKFAWLIRFSYWGKPYRFVFRPKEVINIDKNYTVGNRKIPALDCAKMQMGRTAVYLVKNVLAAAEEDETVLFGFLEIEDGNGHIRTTAEMQDSEIRKLIPAIKYLELSEG